MHDIRYIAIVCKDLNQFADCVDRHQMENAVMIRIGHIKRDASGLLLSSIHVLSGPVSAEDSEFLMSRLRI